MTSLIRETAEGRLRGVSARAPRASIIVVGYNSKAHLGRCFESLLRLEYPGDVELIYVDNQSQDNSSDYVRRAFPSVLVVEPRKNLGYAGGNNFGTQRASGEVLVFLNPDTEVEPNWLVNLVRPFEVEATVGLTTSRILLMHDRDRVNTCGNDVSLAGITWCRGAGQHRDALEDDSDVPAVSGCAFAIRAALFEQLGGFDERFFMYLEDTDLSWRARAAGFRCRYVANSIVYHDYKLSLTPWKIELIERNRYRMLGKHLSLRGLLALTPALLCAEMLTWGYATLHGRRHMLAKSRATVWALTQIGPVLRTRWRPSEGVILRDHKPAPPVVAGIGGAPSRLAQSAIGVLARGTAALSLRLLPRDNVSESGADIELAKQPATFRASGTTSGSEVPGFASADRDVDLRVS
jgi:GT2 family glycosyltransferase